MVEIVPNINASPSRSYARQHHFDSDRMAGTVAVWGAKTSEMAIDSANNLHTMQSTGRTTSPEPSLSFGEFLDVVNPLHHIPIVNTIYQNLTGDDISPVAKIMGGGLYGGPIGAATSIVAAAMDEHGGDNHPALGQALTDENAIAMEESAHATRPANQWKFND